MLLIDETRGADLEDVSWLRRSLRRLCESLRINDRLANDLQLAVSELLTNSIAHAAKPPTALRLRVSLIGAALRLELHDDGTPFLDFKERWNNAAARDVVASGTSGLGIVLARQFLHDVDYTPAHDGVPNRFVGWRRLARRRPAVLLVEDDPTSLALFGAALRENYRVVGANSVEMAISVAESHELDLIVADYHLGEQFSTALFSELERDAARLPVPIILLSAYDRSETRAMALRFGVEEFLKKPVSPRELRHSVEHTLQRSMRRTTGLFRYFGAMSDRLASHPTDEQLASANSAVRFANASMGGGDFSILMQHGSRRRFVLADVMGHGLQAKAGALALGATLRAVNSMSAPTTDCGRFLTEVSRVLRDSASFSGLIATLCVVDDVGQGVFDIALAAHPHVYLISQSHLCSLAESGPLVGMIDAPVYPVTRIALKSGERLLLVSDGVEPFALAGGGELPSAFADVLKSQSAGSLTDCADAAASWLQAAYGPSPKDDWTIMLIEHPKD